LLIQQNFHRKKETVAILVPKQLSNPFFQDTVDSGCLPHAPICLDCKKLCA